jgi:hypothetical protein
MTIRDSEDIRTDMNADDWCNQKMEKKIHIKNTICYEHCRKNISLRVKEF